MFVCCKCLKNGNFVENLLEKCLEINVGKEYSDGDKTFYLRICDI